MSTERTCMALLMFSPHVAAALVWWWLARRDAAATSTRRPPSGHTHPLPEQQP